MDRDFVADPHVLGRFYTLIVDPYAAAVDRRIHPLNREGRWVRLCPPASPEPQLNHGKTTGLPHLQAAMPVRTSAAAGEQYLNQLLVGGLLDVPNVRVSEAQYDVIAGKRWGRSSALAMSSSLMRFDSGIS